MAVVTNPTERPTTARIEQALMARLGLTLDATPEEIEDAHDRLRAFLETAPNELRLWTRMQIAAADEAYALLADDGVSYIPTADEVPVREPASRSSAQVSTPPAARASTLGAAGAGRSLQAAQAAPAVTEDEDLLEEFEEIEGAGMPVGRPKARAARTATKASAHAETSTSRGSDSLLGSRIVRRAVVAVGAVGLVLGIGFTVYNSGAPTVPGISGSPAPEAPGPSVDQAQVAALMQKISADPRDVASLMALGELYFKAGDWKTSGDFMQKAIAVAPENTDARLAYGAAMFNQGDPATAKEQWESVLKLDPNNAEAYYDLGFMYLNQNPPDMDKVRLNWNKVVEIDPNSAIAKTVKTHFAALDPSPSPAASGAAASPAASAAGSSPAAFASPAASGK